MLIELTKLKDSIDIFAKEISESNLMFNEYSYALLKATEIINDIIENGLMINVYQGFNNKKSITYTDLCENYQKIDLHYYSATGLMYILYV